MTFSSAVSLFVGGVLLFFSAHGLAETLDEKIVAAQFLRAKEISEQKEYDAKSFRLTDKMEFYRQEKGNVVVGQEYIDSLRNSAHMELALVFSFLHEFSHNYQSSVTPMEFSDIRSRKKLECEADASAARLLTLYALNSLAVASSNSDIEKVLIDIGDIKRIPSLLPSVTHSLVHLSGMEREHAVLFGTVVALSDFAQNESKTQISERVGRYIYTDGIQTPSPSNLTLMDICSYVVKPEDKGALDRIFLYEKPEDAKERLSKPFQLISNQYELMGDAFKSVEYSYISLSGVNRVGIEKTPSNYVIHAIKLIKVVVPPGETVRFYDEKKYVGYDSKKYSRLPNHTKGSLDRADFFAPPVNVKSCFEKLRLKPSNDDERALRSIITVAKDAANNFESVKGQQRLGIPIYPIDLTLPTNINGNLYLMEMGKFAAFQFQLDETQFMGSLLDSFMTYDKDQAVLVFNRVADLIKKHCKKDIGFENPIKFDGDHEMVIDSFTLGSSATLSIREEYEDSRYLDDDDDVDSEIDDSLEPDGDKYYSVDLSIVKKLSGY